MKKDVLLFLAGTLITCAIAIAPQTRIYHSNYIEQGSTFGIAWDWGGIEIYQGKPAIFLCPASIENGRRIENPIAPFFPDITADC